MYVMLGQIMPTSEQLSMIADPMMLRPGDMQTWMTFSLPSSLIITVLQTSLRMMPNSLRTPRSSMS